MRSAESPQMKPALKQQQQQQQQQQQRPAVLDASDARTAPGQTSLRRSKHHSSGKQHRHHNVQRRHSSCNVGSAGDNGSLSSHLQAVGQTSLIDQLLISSVAPVEHQQQLRHHSGFSKHRQQHQPLMMSELTGHSVANRLAMPHCQEDASQAPGVTCALGAERAASKALTKQWSVSKQFVMATLINCLGHRMRDLQRTDDLAQATDKLQVLGRMRQLLNSIRALDLVKTIYSEGKAARLSAATLGLRPQTLSIDSLRKWSSRENEYHLYWMALLEKAAFSLTQCQDSGAMKAQLDFALALVDIRGFPA